MSTYDLPCNVVKTEILLESVIKFEHSNSNQTFIMNLPSTVVSTHANYSYSFLSFTAEFGSWIGLFTGLSVVQVHYINIEWVLFYTNIFSGATAIGVYWVLDYQNIGNHCVSFITTLCSALHCAFCSQKYICFYRIIVLPQNQFKIYTDLYKEMAFRYVMFCSKKQIHNGCIKGVTLDYHRAACCSVLFY